MPYKAIEIANWFIYKIAESGDLATHLKIQKLLYFAEGWTQVLLNRELFEEDMQAWAHGPAVPEVYQVFKGYGWNPLPVPKKKDLARINGDIKEVLADVLDAYGDYSAKRLEDLTHREDPWKDVRGEVAPEARCEKVIPKSAIRKYYKAKYEINDEKSTKAKSTKAKNS